MRLLLLTYLLLFCGCSFAISPEGLLKKMKTAQKEQNYSYTMSYNVFMGHQSKLVHETYEGNMIKYGDNYFQNLQGTEWVYTPDFTVRIQSKSKQLMISNPMKSMQRVIDLDAISFNSDEMKVIENEGSYEMVITYKSNGISQFEKVTFSVDKETFFMKELNTFYAGERAYLNEDGSTVSGRPKVTITFSDIELNPRIDKSIFDIKNYLVVVAKKAKPTEKYKDYKVHDTRAK